MKEFREGYELDAGVEPTSEEIAEAEIRSLWKRVDEIRKEIRKENEE